MRVAISRPLVFIFLSVLGFNCSLKNDEPLIRVSDISSKDIMSTQLPEEIIFFEKNVNDESKIALISLDMISIGLFTLPHEGNFPILFPDVSKVTYIRSFNLGELQPHGIWIYDLQTSNTEQIMKMQEDSKEVYLSCLSVSSRIDKIIFSVTRFDENHIGLASMNIDGTDFNIMQTDLLMNQCPEYSPDSKTIIVTCAEINPKTSKPGFQLCLLDEYGSYIKTITNRGNGHHSYFFSPDGKYIVYSEFDIRLFSFHPTDRFYSYDLESGEKRLLLEWEVSTKGFSDDSHQIIFEGRPTPKSPWGIYIINIDGTNLRHLTYFDEFLEEWYSDIEDY